MSFNSLAYAIFLPLVLFIYYRLNLKQQNILLLIASYFFYGYWDPRFLSLIIISTVIDYTAGLWIQRSTNAGNQRQRKLGLMLSLFSNLSLLGFFKYFDFFVQSADVMLTKFGLSTCLPVLNIVLPVGISFYTFQTLSYTFDIYRGTLKPTRNFIDFAVFVSFFPQLVAGPIERAANLLPQIEKPRVVNQDHFNKGIYLILVGLVRKVVIADTAGSLIESYFANPASYSGEQLIIGLFLYGLQIYGDFAGYSDIARGSSYLLGIELMRNFRHPYFAVNITDFWRRWHISLSQWLRDYLYISLGGNRKGKARTYLNNMITMLLGGLWHGASWNFVFWGFLHGLYLAVHKFFRNLVPYKKPASKNWWYYCKYAINLLFTLCLANFTWLFFRSKDVATTKEYLIGLTRLQWDIPIAALPLLFLTLLILSIDLPQAINDDEYAVLKLNWVWKTLMACAALLLLFICGGYRAPFIYFQF